MRFVLTRDADAVAVTHELLIRVKVPQLRPLFAATVSQRLV